MASSTTSNVYLYVIEDVINKVRDELVNGPGESVLNELQGIWELKMMQAGAISGLMERSTAQKPASGGPVQDLNVPYEGTEEYETPTAEMLFPPTPLQTPIPTPLPGTAQTPLPGTAQTPLPGAAQTPLPGTADNSSFNIPTGGTPLTPNEYTSGNDNGGVTETKAARPSPYMQPPSAWMNQRPPLGVDVNVAYVEGREEPDRGTSLQPRTKDFFTMSGKRKHEDFASQNRSNGGYIPQRDGAGDAILDDLQASQGVNTVGNTATDINQEVVMLGVGLSSRIPQLDGPVPDPYDDMLSTPNIYNYQGVADEDYNIANTPAPHDQAGTPAIVAQNDAGEDDDDDDEPLNENDDDDDFDDVGEGEELSTQYLVLAQFDKVTRTKSRWKCTLKDGIMRTKNKDILFNKATGEFDF
ncbi:hypothetical protein NMG60_11034103 [Bertholletia excelsa]